MTYKPQAICGWPGCNTLILTKPGEPYRCSKHPVLDRAPDERVSADKRGYDSKWRKLRDIYIKQHPICEPQYVCDGSPSVDVDHIVPIAADWQLRLNESNLQAICRACHAHKTKRLDRKIAADHQGRAKREPEL